MKKTEQEEQSKQKQTVDQQTTGEQIPVTEEPAAETHDTEEAAEKIVADIENLTNQVSELKDKNLRLMAEFDNFRRRSLKERSDLIKSAGEDVLKNILPLVDDFERALNAMETSEDAKAIKEGIDLIYNKFITFLGENGVKSIPTQNEDFNTDLHEAITMFPAPTEEQKGKIIDCVSKGYTLNEKVIRFSKVVVGK